jgi:histidinol phosphatase-like enzyme
MDLKRFLEPDRTWCQVLGSVPDRRDARRPALFLDRDGVVVEEVHFLHRPEDVTLMANAARVIARARALGMAVVLATNQSGIARGLYGASWVIGDRARDLEAGRAAGCAGGLHVLTGHGRRERAAAATLQADDFNVHLGASIAAAAKLPLLQG